MNDAVLTLQEGLLRDIALLAAGGGRLTAPLYFFEGRGEFYAGTPHLLSYMKTGNVSIGKTDMLIGLKDEMEYELEAMGGSGSAGAARWTIFRNRLGVVPAFRELIESPSLAEDFLRALLGSSRFHIPGGGNISRICYSHPGGYLAAASAGAGEMDGVCLARHDRTLAWMGMETLMKVRNTALGCVGAGGLMNAFITEAMHLGFRKFIIADDDRLDESNRNRFIGAGTDCAERLKTELMREIIRRFDPSAEVETVDRKFPFDGGAAAFSRADILVCGVDNDYSRLNTQLYALAFSKPLFDMGCGIFLKETGGNPEIDDSGGQVRVSLPGQGCLACMGMDLAGIRDLRREEINRQRGYIAGTEWTPPSVITINAAIASICLHLLTDYIAIRKINSRHIVYSEKNLELRKIQVPVFTECPVCGIHQ